jgi:hypothetical protein
MTIAGTSKFLMVITWIMSSTACSIIATVIIATTTVQFG